MKKLLLLTATMGLAFSGSYAQQQQKTILSPQNRGEGGRMVTPIKGKSTTAHKPTDAVSGEWFCFTDAQTNPSTEASVWPVTPDSNLSTGNFNWYLHGIGTSFDPKSTKFQITNFANATPVYPMPSFIVGANNAYTVDSISIVGFYNRYHDNGVDTLYIDVVASGTPGTYNVTYQYLDVIAQRNDSLLQIAEPIYNWEANGITPDSVPQVQRIVKYLDQAAFGDSTADGFHIWDFPVNISVAAGQKVIAFVHFGSYNYYALNEAYDTANYWMHYTSALYGANNDPHQIPDDYNGGLLATTLERYHIGDYYYLSNGSAVLAPAYAYTPHFMNDPWFAFHVKCPTCVVSVKTPSAVSVTDAYPNPAANTISIPFSVNEAAAVKVVVTNATGATIATQELGKYNANQSGKATFDVANYANGVYFYTVEANGQRITKRFVVTH